MQEKLTHVFVCKVQELAPLPRAQADACLMPFDVLLCKLLRLPVSTLMFFRIVYRRAKLSLENLFFVAELRKENFDKVSN